MRRSHLAAVLWTAVSIVAALAQSATVSASAGNRYLFVVETSSAMRRLENASRQTVFDLIFTGLHGQMQPGDTFGLWTYNRETYSGQFPMQVWHTNTARDLASAAVAFLKTQRCESKAALSATLAKVLNVVKEVQDVSVFLVTDGSARVHGTPFDDEIKAGYERQAAEQRRLKNPFVTTLVAQRGQIVTALVTIGGERIPLPVASAPDVAVSAPMDGLAHTTGNLTASPEPIPGTKPSWSAPSPDQIRAGADGGAHGFVVSRSELGSANTTHEPDPPLEARFSKRTATAAPPSNPPALSQPLPSNSSSTASQPLAASVPPAPVGPPEFAPPAAASSERSPAETSLKPTTNEPVHSVPSSPPALSPTNTPAPPASPGLESPTTKILPPTPPKVAPAPFPEKKMRSRMLANEAGTQSPSPMALPDAFPSGLVASARENPVGSVGSNTTPSGPVGVAHPQPSRKVEWLLFTGIMLLLIAIGLLLVVLQRMRQPPSASFISRGLDRE